MDMPSTDPFTRGASIRVVRDESDAPQWEIGDDSRPTRVLLLIDEPRWSGFTFSLAYNGRDLAEVTVLRDETAEPLTAALFQRVPLGSLDRAARECVSSFLAAWDEANPSTAAALFPDPLDWLDEVADGETDRESDERLAKLCRRYLELGAQKDWRQTLADEFHYSLPSVQTIIGRARKRRFLTPVARGQHGGQLTPKALQLLAPPQTKTAWDLATEEMRQGAIEREQTRARIHDEQLAQFRDGQMNAATYRARALALDSLLMGGEPEKDYPDESARELREATRYLRSQYKELGE